MLLEKWEVLRQEGGSGGEHEAGLRRGEAWRQRRRRAGGEGGIGRTKEETREPHLLASRRKEMKELWARRLQEAFARRPQGMEKDHPETVKENLQEHLEGEN